MYALTGASGQLGRLVLQHLLAQMPATQIIATTRDPHKLADIEAQGVIVRKADFSQPETLPEAFAGATRLLIISTDVVGQRVEGHEAAIAGAVAAGVNHIVYTSAPHADTRAHHPILIEHGHTEAALAASGIVWTALRNCLYAEVLKNLVSVLLVNDQLLIPEGNSKQSWIVREDCARAAAGALLGKLPVSGPVDTTGPEALSFTEVAQCLSSIAGHSITARVLPDDEIIAQVTAKGVSHAEASFIVRLANWIAHEASILPTSTVEQASGVKPSHVDVVLRTLIASSTE